MSHSYHLLQLTHTSENIMYKGSVYMLSRLSPHWLSQDPPQLEKEWSQRLFVSQSVDMIVRGYHLNCTQPLLLFSP